MSRQLFPTHGQIVGFPLHLRPKRLGNLHRDRLITENQGIVEGIEFLQIGEGERSHPQPGAAVQTAGTADQPAHVCRHRFVRLAPLRVQIKAHIDPFFIQEFLQQNLPDGGAAPKEVQVSTRDLLQHVFLLKAVIKA